MIYAIIGCNYGDEGKGLATDYLASRPGKVLVIRHNGGAQAGHTVEFNDKRFVFHELSAGSFRGADTYWADSFFPDLFKLEEEVQSFSKQSGRTPGIYASSACCITTIDDILINMLQESLRGEERHGSCGMGINEADLRKKAGYAITLGHLKAYSADALFRRLKQIREEYSNQRLKELKLALSGKNEYLEMLEDDEVLRNFTDSVVNNCRYFMLVQDMKSFFDKYDTIIFEGAQGLSLDSECQKNWPHVTASRTGLTNVLRILCEYNRKLDEVIYVTRSYVTKHGAGPLKNECSELLGNQKQLDKTNVNNMWQGRLRYACFSDADELLNRILEDCGSCSYKVIQSLMITHLNETENKMAFRPEAMEVMSFIKKDVYQRGLTKVYLSSTRYAEDITEIYT